MTAPRTIVVVGAGASNLKSVVAANLVVACAALDVAVALDDRHGASTRALAVGAALDVDGRLARLPWIPRPIALGTPAGVSLVVVDPPPRLDATTCAAVDGADVVLVPVDASPLARRVLRDVAARVAASPAPDRLRVALSRVVPRDVDRWALVEELDGEALGALLHATLPMARPRYAPRTAAARAYARLARELLVPLGLVSSDASSVSTSA